MGQGRYEYCFSVDGTWTHDPDLPTIKNSQVYLTQILSFPHVHHRCRVATTTCSRLWMPKTSLPTRRPTWRRWRKQRSLAWQTLWRNASPTQRSTKLSRERSFSQLGPSPTSPQTSLRTGTSAVKVLMISTISLILTKRWTWRTQSSSPNRLYPIVR